MMTTNYTHIFNDNLDMFDTTECMGIAETLRYEEQMRQEDEYDMACLMGWDEYDEPSQETFDYLHKLEQEMQEIVERCGVYGAEQWAEVASVYSDVYKDCYGMRPEGIWLRYHGIRA